MKEKSEKTKLFREEGKQIFFFTHDKWIRDCQTMFCSDARSLRQNYCQMVHTQKSVMVGLRKTLKTNGGKVSW